MLVNFGVERRRMERRRLLALAYISVSSAPRSIRRHLSGQPTKNSSDRPTQENTAGRVSSIQAKPPTDFLLFCRVYRSERGKTDVRHLGRVVLDFLMSREEMAKMVPACRYLLVFAGCGKDRSKINDLGSREIVFVISRQKWAKMVPFGPEEMRAIH